jgi:hypothetical protein
MNRWALRMRRAQHKRPGTTARRERQERAVDGLLERARLANRVLTDREMYETAILRQRLGNRITTESSLEI